MIAATEANEVTAFDATGRMVWQREFGSAQTMLNASEARVALRHPKWIT